MQVGTQIPLLNLPHGCENVNARVDFLPARARHLRVAPAPQGRPAPQSGSQMLGVQLNATPSAKAPGTILIANTAPVKTG